MSAQEHIAAFEAAFAQALAARPNDVHENTYAFAGKTLLIRAVGSELATVLGRPLLRTSVNAGNPELRLDVWDESSGIPVPQLGLVPVVEERGGPAGEVLECSVDRAAVRFSGPHFAHWLDCSSRRIVGWIRAADRLSSWQRYRPLQTMLGSWLASSGVRVSHAAAVARNGAAVLLVGPNGAGKSTCAMACLSAGMELLGDDVVAVDTAARTVHTLYTVVKVRTPPDVLDGVALMNDPDGLPEWVTFLTESAPERLRSKAPIVAIAFPRLKTAKASSLTPIGRGIAMTTLLAADQTRNSDEIAAIFEDWARLVDQVPAYSLDVGSDPIMLAAAIRTLTEDVAL